MNKEDQPKFDSAAYARLQRLQMMSHRPVDADRSDNTVAPRLVNWRIFAE